MYRRNKLELVDTYQFLGTALEEIESHEIDINEGILIKRNNYTDEDESAQNYIQAYTVIWMAIVNLNNEIKK